MFSTPLKRVAQAIAVLAFVALFSVAATAAPLTIGPNDDGFLTSLMPPSFATLALPPGFFGAKSGTPSDPFGPQDVQVTTHITVDVSTGTTVLIGPGCHTGMVNRHCYEMQQTMPVDTIVRRGGGVLDDAGVLTVPIELRYLSIRSVDPITVTYGPEPSSFFDVFVTLDNLPPQTPGTLTFEREGSTNGGFMNTVLPVTYRVQFVNRDSNGFSPADVIAQDILRSIGRMDGNRFSVVPEPGSLALVGIGCAALAAFARRRKGAVTS